MEGKVKEEVKLEAPKEAFGHNVPDIVNDPSAGGGKG